MLDWKELANFGIPGLLLAGVFYLGARLIERGFTLQVPPKRR